MVFFAPYSFQTKPDQPPCLDGVVQGEEEGRSVLMYTDEVRGCDFRNMRRWSYCNFCQADFNHASSYKTFISES